MYIGFMFEHGMYVGMSFLHSIFGAFGECIEGVHFEYRMMCKLQLAATQGDHRQQTTVFTYQLQ